MRDQNLAAMSRRLADELGSGIALIAPDRDWTYAQVDHAYNQLAQALRQDGIGPADRVGAVTKDLAACLLLQLAASKIGAVFVPHNWRLAPRELEYVISFSQTRILVTDREFLDPLSKAHTPKVQRMLVTDATGLLSFHAWYAGQPARDPGATPAPDDTALQLSSSGTTGLPKGIELTHRNLLLLADEGPRQIWRGARELRFLSALPNFHIAGMGNLITMFYQGGTTVAHREFAPAAIIADIARHRITHSFLVPAMMQAIVQHPDAATGDFSSLRGIAYGGSPISEKLMRDSVRTFACDLFQVYGMTEATGLVTCLPPEDHTADGPRAHLMRSAGRPADGVSVRIVGPATGDDLPEGSVGEILVRTARNMRCYFHNEEATTQVFPDGRDAQGGWFRSGDAGYLSEGYLYIHDRIRDMVISGGENIYPAEVENILAAHPDVVDSAVIGVPDERWGESVKACVVRRPGASVGDAEVIAFCRERLAHYKCPKSVDFIDSLPRNQTGKILKRILREPYWAGRERNVS